MGDVEQHGGPFDIVSHQVETIGAAGAITLTTFPIEVTCNVPALAYCEARHALV
jgi:hypothetical protein